MRLPARSCASGSDPFSEWTRTDTIPFDANARYMATLHHDHAGRAEIHAKGAPECLLSMCASQRTADGGEAPLDPESLESRGGDHRRSGPARARACGAIGSPGPSRSEHGGHRWRAGAARASRADRSAARRGNRRRRRMPWCGHSGENDHRRSRRNRGGDRPPGRPAESGRVCSREPRSNR